MVVRKGGSIDGRDYVTDRLKQEGRFDSNGYRGNPKVWRVCKGGSKVHHELR